MKNKNRSSNTQETKRRRREFVTIIITITLIVILTYFESDLSHIKELLPMSNELFIFGLININLILIILLIFLIVRNLVKIIFERRRGILGSRLRTKLVVAFISLSLIPTVVLFLVSIKFLSYSIDNWFNVKIGNALNVSLEVAQNYYQQYTESTQYQAKQISAEITEKFLYEDNNFTLLKKLLEEKRQTFSVNGIEVHLDNREIDMSVYKTDDPNIPEILYSPQVRESIYMGKTVSTMQSIPAGDMIRGIAPLFSQYTPREVIGNVVVTHLIYKDFTDRMSIILKTSEFYKQMQLLQNPIKVSFIVILAIVTLLIIFSATWFGIFLARGITVPIQELAEATREIAQGNLDYQISVLEKDEIGTLANSFNQMTQNLKTSNEGLTFANIDLERRRQYMETVLRHVSAGVVSIDRNDVISTINNAAEKMLDITADKILNRRYQDVLKSEYIQLVSDIIAELKGSGGNFLEKQVQLILDDRILTILVATTILLSDMGEYMGIVAVLEDLTQLQKIERVAAWREVARRIAHEIKNPLTPVKLSAERLQRRYGGKMGEEEGRVLKECTQTIVKQVDILKNLVNEFSQFARIPETRLVPNDLNTVIGESVVLYNDAHRDISFSIIVDDAIPLINIDAEQIKRVMINLLDNAVSAIESSGVNGSIEIVTSLEVNAGVVRVDVKDNGPGISSANKVRMFEPYFSTKKFGTGLGLAIVDSIISDHHGTVNVNDNVPHGTVISFEIPIHYHI